ncbi:hypothetical protein ILUMI_03220 [Ignelater luminosus]|uniref:Uncharacterized protein n=1 Tax=Ignelater luminosus TaxID=2038154 RepID=A0A8K0DG79_IGNLU|nr:hypothetical protein ILUMI_03220 [Ignelater luminosus]
MSDDYSTDDETKKHKAERIEDIFSRRAKIGGTPSKQSKKIEEKLDMLIEMIWALKISSADIMFDRTMVPTVSHEKFLGNPEKKNRLIEMIMAELRAANMQGKPAKENANILIITTALDAASQDIDLLVILTGFSNNASNVYLLKSGKEKTPQQMYSPKTAINKTVAQKILFLHAFSGCDTTFALCGQGKLKFIKTLH